MVFFFFGGSFAPFTSGKLHQRRALGFGQFCSQQLIKLLARCHPANQVF
jgi:hypothetical protein